MIELTKEQAHVLSAFISAFELNTTGVWTIVENAMREDWGIEDPEAALEDAAQALQQ